jgi:hypothetical protein
MTAFEKLLEMVLFQARSLSADFSGDLMDDCHFKIVVQVVITTVHLQRHLDLSVLRSFTPVRLRMATYCADSSNLSAFPASAIHLFSKLRLVTSRESLKQGRSLKS